MTSDAAALIHDLRDVAPTAIPAALARLHRTLQPGDQVELLLPTGLVDAAGPPPLDDLLSGAGFAADTTTGTGHEPESAPLSVIRRWTLADTVGPDLDLLVCGLNPSPAAADDGVGFAGPSNRFWPAAIAAGLVSVDRDAHAALEVGVGMTDLVKRTTRRADELTSAEYAQGVARLERLCDWLRPSAVCLVGLAGWRAAVDRKAAAGWQAASLGPSPVYLMPSTSGLNAHETVGSLTDHVLAAAAGPD
ncbi:MAG: mismatch-specific DNA-glycosylase [Actinomycetota bacterium]